MCDSRLSDDRRYVNDRRHGRGSRHGRHSAANRSSSERQRLLSGVAEHGTDAGCDGRDTASSWTGNRGGKRRNRFLDHRLLRLNKTKLKNLFCSLDENLVKKYFWKDFPNIKLTQKVKGSKRMDRGSLDRIALDRITWSKFSNKTGVWSKLCLITWSKVLINDFNILSLDRIFWDFSVDRKF